MTESEMLARTGVLAPEDEEGLYPCDEARLTKMAFVVAECIQEIPCNPCVHVCPQGAISMKDINAPPVVDGELCNGCMTCVRLCPGLAIFGIDVSRERPRVMLPYELQPLPLKDEVVDALDRNGEVVGKATVVRVQSPGKWGKTVIVTLELGAGMERIVRNFRRRSP